MANNVLILEFKVSKLSHLKMEIEYLNIFVTFMFPKFYYKLLCFDKNIIGQIGVQGLNKYLNLPYKIGLIWGGWAFQFH